MDIVERLRSVFGVVVKADDCFEEDYSVARKAADEIERLRENAKQDAKFLSAYHRICQKHGIAPSSSDLIAAMEECDERTN